MEGISFDDVAEVEEVRDVDSDVSVAIPENGGEEGFRERNREARVTYVLRLPGSPSVLRDYV